jgi:2-haloacid dehalogenase
MPRWVTFDCYGTLIDWTSGIGATLERLWPREDAGALLARYHEIEPRIEADEPGLAYREVMRRCLSRLADEAGLPLTPERAQALGHSLPKWPAFREVPAALAELRVRGWKLAILSNTDADLLAASLLRLGAPFDECVVASEIGSYKPAHGHWLEFRARTGAAPAEHVHVGASLYHDVRPALELGLRCVWINRLGERADPAPTLELPDLAKLPHSLDRLPA